MYCVWSKGFYRTGYTIIQRMQYFQVISENKLLIQTHEKVLLEKYCYSLEYRQ